MTKYVGEFGKRWDVRVPRNDIRWLMGNRHVATPDSEIEAEIRCRVGNDPRFTPSLIRQSVAFALECHKRNRELFNHVMRGR
jgi:hypothetical protein